MKKVTNVSPINWKESFLSHPLIIVDVTTPTYYGYRINCKDLSDDGTSLTVFPSLCDIDEILEILAECLQENSNFRAMLKEYYGDEIFNLTQIEFYFSDILVVITQQMTVEEAKLNWLRDCIKAGYKGLKMTPAERSALGITCKNAGSMLCKISLCRLDCVECTQ